jgi:hypothetical protein
LHDRQIAGLLPLEDAANIDACLTMRIGQARCVAHEAAGIDKFALLLTRKKNASPARSKDGSQRVFARRQNWHRN